MSQFKAKAVPTNWGVPTSIRGSVVNMRFDAHLPSISILLRTGKFKVLPFHRVVGGVSISLLCTQPHLSDSELELTFEADNLQSMS